jgi:ABC-2 type transport system permease protein
LTALWSIAVKDLKILSRDRSALVFLFGFPLIFTAIFGVIYGGHGPQSAPQIKVLVANLDTGKHGAELLDALAKVGVAVDVERGGPAAVEKRVRAGEQPVGLVIPVDYSSRLDAAIAAAAGGAPNPSQARITRYVDPAQSQIAAMAEGAIAGALQRSVSLLYRKAALDRIPAEYREQARRDAAVGSAQSAVAFDTVEAHQKTQLTPGDLFIPGFAVYFVFTIANGVAATLLYERQEGTLRRMLSAPVTRAQILFGKMLARGLVGLVQTAVLFAIGKLVLHLSFTWSDIPAVTLIAVLAVFASTGLGLLIATFAKTMEQIQGMTTMALLVMGFISGTLIPKSLLSPSLQKLGYITPHAWALQAYDDVMLRHLPITATLLNLVVLLAFGIAFYLLALGRFKFEI